MLVGPTRLYSTHSSPVHQSLRDVTPLYGDSLTIPSVETLHQGRESVTPWVVETGQGISNPQCKVHRVANLPLL